jgi:hypothetical protein
LEEKMSFLNSLLIRITLAVIGGIFYAFLTHSIVTFFKLPYEFVILASVLVSLFYLSSRLLLLFSGIDSPYYSKKGKEPSKTLTEKNSFSATAQWVGKFYHQHDLVLFVFLGILSVVFLISLVLDALWGKPFGNTIQDLWGIFLSSF